jgi:hypothetical protein
VPLVLQQNKPQYLFGAVPLQLGQQKTLSPKHSPGQSESVEHEPLLPPPPPEPDGVLLHMMHALLPLQAASAAAAVV